MEELPAPPSSAPDLWESCELTMGRGAGAIDPARIDGDRAAMGGHARSWARTPSERGLLAAGWAKAAEAALIVCVASREGAASGRPLACRAYGLDAVLALGGKARAKKALLELAARPGGASSKWFGVACRRLLREAAGSLSFNDWSRGPQSDLLEQAESAMFFLGAFGAGMRSDGRAMVATASVEDARALPALDKALSFAFGGEFHDLLHCFPESGSYSLEPTPEAVSSGLAWAKARSERSAMLMESASAAPARVQGLRM